MVAGGGPCRPRRPAPHPGRRRSRLRGPAVPGDDLLGAAVEALRGGRRVGVPTDTVYGIAVEPSRPEALRGLFELKGRSGDRPIALLVADLGQAASLVRLTPAAEELASRHWPGALTLVLRREPGAPEWLGDSRRGTVGVRAPHHPVALALLRAAGPLAVTSANRSGEAPARSAEDAREIFGDAVSVYLPGDCPGGEASTVVDLTLDPPVVLRPGPVDPLAR